MVPFPPVAPGDPIDVSATTYVAYRQCPESAAARLRGEYGPDSTAGFRGGLSHRIFARHLKSGPIDAAGFQQACREEIGSGLNAKMASLGLRPSELGRIISEVGESYERFKKMSTVGFQEAEVLLEAEPAEGVRLRGGVDAVFADDSGIRIVDWKTGNLGDSVDDQLAFYALLWTLARGQRPATVEAMSVKTGQRTSTVPDDGELERTAGRVAGLIDTIRSAWAGGPEPGKRPGGWCRFCPVLQDCSEGQAAQRVMASA